LYDTSELQTLIILVFPQDDDRDENSLKEMLKSAVQTVWDTALDYKIVP
jgi:hypothetical protein